MDKREIWTPSQILRNAFLLFAGFFSACGTLQVDIEEPDATLSPPATSMAEPLSSPTASEGQRETFPAVAWYGTIHSIPGSTNGSDYLKPWHLAIWPKFGRAVGLTGIDPVINAEIDRLRDQDTKATFWGELVCGVADYGTCQLLVELISANDGGPQYEADKVEDWTGRIGHLPVQPGSQDELLYFVLDGPVIALYGIGSDNPDIQAELERLAGETLEPEGGHDIRIWGELNSKTQPVTGTRINVERLGIYPS